jgi:methylmalonyl-CoA mutase N-terminal domain/subunit
MKPYAIAQQIVTPMGWKIDRSASMKRLFCGMNSRQMVVSMGILPPMPNPLKAVTTRKAL